MPANVVKILEIADYGREVRRGAGMLRAGGVVVLPTETVYGAAGVLTQATAVEKLRSLRSGGRGKPFTIHVARREDAMRYLGDVSDLGRRMMRKLWPGPVGLVFEVPAERRRAVAGELKVAETEIYDDSTITIRCPQDPVAEDVIGQVEAPVVLTLAGDRPVLRAADLEQSIAEKIDLIYDAGTTKFSKPSTIVKVDGNEYKIVREGVYDERIIERLLRTTVLFVCSGNTCRSPMAESLTKQIISERLKVPVDDLDKRGVTVMSAGVMAMPGSRATPAAVEAVRKLGADLSKHRSRPLTVELVNQADVIFTMGRSHADVITALVPSASDKVTTLDPAGDIEDPIGASVAVYEDLAGKLKGLIERRLWERIVL